MSRDVLLLLSFAVLIFVAAHLMSRSAEPPEKSGTAANIDPE